MASKLSRVASTTHRALSRTSRVTSSRWLVPSSPAIQQRYASGGFHWDPAPNPIEEILKQGAEPHTPEEWKEIGVSALNSCSSQAERDAVQAYITNALKPTLTDEEVLALSAQVGVSLKTPEDLAAAHGVVKQIMKAATLSEAETLFAYFDKTGEFPKDIQIVLSENLNKALASPSAAASHVESHDHHDDHSHGHDTTDHGHGAGAHGQTKESFGIGWYLALGAIPFSYVLFTLTESKRSEDNKPFLTRLIAKYDHWRDEWALRNELHTKSVEQAGFDRLLFRQANVSEGRGTGRRDVRFEDAINQGPPINVTPGSYANVDKVIEHYKRLNQETEDRRQEIERYYAEKAQNRS